MSRYCFYVDGFNMYYALQNGYRHFKWLNYRSLAEQVIKPMDSLAEVYYFTAYVTWHPRAVMRHMEYIKALRSAGVTHVSGRFQVKRIRCHLCQGRMSILH